MRKEESSEVEHQHMKNGTGRTTADLLTSRVREYGPQRNSSFRNEFAIIYG